MFATAALLLSACGGGGDSTGTGPVTPPGGGGPPPGGTPVITTIAVSPATLSLTVGASQTLTAVARSAQNAEISTTFAWEVDNVAVATIASTGVVTAVSVGTTVVRARAGAVSGTATLAVTAPPVVLPAAPTNLRAQSVRGRVTLTWTDNSSSETGFDIARRRTGGAGDTILATVAANVTSFADTLITTSSSLEYRVRARSADTVSAYSDALATVPLAPIEVALKELSVIAARALPDPRLPSDGRNLTAELDALVPLLLAHPEVDTVLIQRQTSTAQIILHDSTSILLPHNKIPTAAERAASSALRLANAQTPSATSWRTLSPLTGRAEGTRAASVPGATRAGIVSIGGGAEVLPEISRILGAAGYAVQTLGGSIEHFRNYRGLGALYLDSHGAGFRSQREGRNVYGVETTTEVSKASAGQYAEELRRGDLTFLMVPLVDLFGVGDQIDIDAFWSVKFAVTESFIARYWQLSDAIVVLHTCFGGAREFDGFTPSLVRSAMKQVGASVVMSYDSYVWPTSSLPSMAYFLDRMTGANQRGPFINPPRRAFALDKVRSSMAINNLLSHTRSVENSPNTTFDTDKAPGDVIGMPSIERAIVTEDAGQSDAELVIQGTFSEAQGTVTIGAQPVQLSAWSNSEIRARTAFGATGQLVVEAPGGLRSNEVPLTEWRGGLTLTVDPGQGTLKATTQMDVRFRADIHRVRRQVEDAPESEPVTAYISPLSFAQVIGSGSFASGNGTITWLPTPEIPILGKAEVDAGGVFSTTRALFGGKATINADARTLRLCFSLSGFVRMRGEGNGPPAEQDVMITIVFPELVDASEGQMSCLNLTLDGTWSTAAGSRSHTADDNVRLKLEWTRFLPTTPPTSGTKS